MNITRKVILVLLLSASYTNNSMVQGQEQQLRHRALKKGMGPGEAKQPGKAKKPKGGGGGDRTGSFGPFDLVENKQCLPSSDPLVVQAKRSTTIYNPCYTLDGCTGGCCRVRSDPNVLLCDTRNLFPNLPCVCGSQVPGVAGGFVVPLP
jgi:hypothetical protein